MYLSFFSQLLVVVRRHRLQVSCVKYKSDVQVKHRYVNRTVTHGTALAHAGTQVTQSFLGFFR